MAVCDTSLLQDLNNYAQTMEHDELHVDEHGIYCEFYRESWEDAGHPMACVTLENKFLRVNHAFERLLGYSDSELRDTSWVDITRKEHVGGDLSSVNDVIEGRVDSYRMEKDYRHKRGHYVPIVLSVRRFPRATHVPILLFRVEAPVAVATRVEIADLSEHFNTTVRTLREEIERLRTGVHVSNHVGDNNTTGDNNTGFDNVGRDKTVGDVMTRMLLMLLILALIGIGVLLYDQSERQLQQPQPTQRPKHNNGFDTTTHLEGI